MSNQVFGENSGYLECLVPTIAPLRALEENKNKN
jgi:hypothetical protein